MAVNQNGCALQFVPCDKLTDEICKISINQYGYALGYIPNDKQTDEVCKIAVNRRWLSVTICTKR